MHVAMFVVVMPTPEGSCVRRALKRCEGGSGAGTARRSKVDLFSALSSCCGAWVIHGDHVGTMVREFAELGKRRFASVRRSVRVDTRRARWSLGRLFGDARPPRSWGPPRLGVRLLRSSVAAACPRW